MKHLVIVESPNKIKSIEKYLGEDYKVLASVGHIVYLPSSGEHRFGVDMETWTPRYKISPDKVDVVKQLREAVKDVDMVYVATDPDREGEAIADNLVEFLRIKNKHQRIRFNEITEDAVKRALGKPAEVDNLLVDSQVARRILDRIIGYKLSGLMKAKIQGSPTAPSAGRVQSIALKLVIEREKLIDAFIPTVFFLGEGTFAKYPELSAVYYDGANPVNKNWLMPENVEKVKGELTKKLTVKEVVTSVRKEAKKTPFKQAALYKRADSTLSMSARNTQRAAQKLYEGYGDGGLISYPRTDSTRLSDTFVKAARKYLTKTYGAEFIADELRGVAGDQDAHEAIRPTSMSLTPSLANAKFNLEGSEAKLYKLIWTHTAQALMNPPQKEHLRYEFDDAGHQFRMSTSKVLFEGYYKVTGYEKGRELPKLAKGDTLDVTDYIFEENQTKPPARYNDGTLIEKLDDIKVGRPSTFATTVNILKDRHYVDLEGKALVPTEFGKTVMQKLLDAFPQIITETYTAQIERELDEVAEGKHDYRDILNNFWDEFQKGLLTATQELEVTRMMPILAGKKCPLCGSELVVRYNKRTQQRFFGCSNFPNCSHMEPDPTSKARRKFWGKKKK